jgi:hypothetical protein
MDLAFFEFWFVVMCSDLWLMFCDNYPFNN